MTAIAVKLKAAGIDTAGSQITIACIEGLRLHHGNIGKAWAHAGTSCGYAVLRELAVEMNFPKEPQRSAQPIEARTLPPERVQRREKLRHIIRSKYSHSGGVAWSDIGWHELPGLTRDGKEATALLAAGPANVPNDGRTVGHVLGIKKTDQIIEAAREVSRT